MNGWFSASAWQQAAQDALKTVQHDLQEFRQAIQEDTGEVVRLSSFGSPVHPRIANTRLGGSWRDETILSNISSGRVPCQT